MHCKFDQLCSVFCSGSIEPVSNFPWYVLTMAGFDDDPPGGSNQQPMAREELENLLRDALAANKRNNEGISEQRAAERVHPEKA